MKTLRKQNVTAAKSDLCKSGIEFIIGESINALPYLFDSTDVKGAAPFIVIPSSIEQLEESVRILVAHRLPMTVRGSGTGTAGGCLPLSGALIFTGRLNRFILHEENFTVEAEAGVLTGDIKAEAEKHGLIYPPDPASYKYSTIGGNIACNAGGPSSVKYGSTREYLKKIQITDGAGKTLVFGEEVQKFSTAYFIPALFCGSEGTLGVLSKAWLRLVPMPHLCHYYELISPRADEFHALRMLGVANMEYLDERAGEIATGKKLSYLLLKLEAFSTAEMTAAKGDIESFFRRNKYKFRSGADRGDIWAARESLSPLSYKLGDIKIAQDIVLPLSKIPVFLDWLKGQRLIKSNAGLELFAFGHLGDGNLHVNIMANEKGKARGLHLQEKIMLEVRQLGGIISGEHGIGFLRKDYLPQFIGKNEIALMKELKKVFDPYDLMNPGKIF